MCTCLGFVVMLSFLKGIVYMTVLFSSRQKYVVKVMFCQILQFVSILKTQQIKNFNCTGGIYFQNCNTHWYW